MVIIVTTLKLPFVSNHSGPKVYLPPGELTKQATAWFYGSMLFPIIAA